MSDIVGLSVINDPTDAINGIIVNVGSASDSTGTYTLALTSAISRKLNALFGVGSGMLDTGTKAANACYHIRAICNPTTGVSDVLASTSFYSPVLPSGFVTGRWLTAIFTDAAGTIRPFRHLGNESWFFNDVLSLSSVVTGPYPSVQTVHVPVGIKVKASIFYLATSASGAKYGWGYLRDPDRGAIPNPLTSAEGDYFYLPGTYAVDELDVWTNNLGQIAIAILDDVTTPGSDGRLNVRTRGWTVDRSIYK